MKKEVASAIALTLLILLGTSVATFEIQRIVSTTSSDTVWYVGVGFPFSTIQEAINNASVENGDTIEVHWNYTSNPESVQVNKTLTIRPYAPDPQPPTVYDFSVEVPGVEIDDFIVLGQIYLNSSNSVINNNTADSIYISSWSSNNTLTNNLVSNFETGNSDNLGTQNIDASNMLNGKPIYYLVNQQNMPIPANAGYVAIVNSANITAEDLSLGPNSDGDGALVWNSTAVTFANVSLTNHYIGIDVEYSSQITVNGLNLQLPYSYISGYGVYFFDVNDSNIENANFNLNAVGLSAIELDSSSNNNVGPNVESSYGSSDVAINLNNCEGNQIADNIITNTGDNVYGGCGIGLEESNNNTVVANNISGTRVGLAMDSSNWSMFFHNNFLNNHQQTSGVGNFNNSFDNGYEGNFWSDYNGIDVNGTGIGSLPYVVGLGPGSDDNHPLMKPWSENCVYERPMLITVNPAYTQELYTFSNCTLGLPVGPSTAAGFTFNRSLPPTITLNATCGYCGFLDITIPRNWIDGPFNVTVTVDGVSCNVTDCQLAVNSTFSSIYIIFNSSGTHTVKITGSVLGSITGDLNGDGVVDIYDAIIFASNFGAQEQP